MILALKDTQDCIGYECLKNYIDRPEPLYKWADLGHRLEIDDLEDGTGGWTGYVLNFTSQQWLSEEIVSKSEWWHIMLVIVPHEVQVKDTAMLWITGGTNNYDDDGQVDVTDEEVLLLSNIAVSNKIVAAVLFQIPNQPIVFSEDVLQDSRKEDGIIAFTWWHFLTDPTSDAEYLLRLPMTKGAVKAMDTVTNFLTSETAPEEIQGMGLNPSKFFVAGASKRGWTTWTTAVVDPRVIGILPVVMDELNFIENIKHHYMSYGGWSFALSDYWKLNLTMYFDDPKMQVMFDIVDAYEHRDRMMMPKYVVNAANDEFFLPTDTGYWWDKMPNYYELNRFILLPNTEHSMITGLLEILPTVNAWISQILLAHIKIAEENGPKEITTIEQRNEVSQQIMSIANIPRFNWTIDPENGDITVMSEVQPVSVSVWHAITCNSERRDWRIANLDDPCTCGFVVPGEDYCANLAVLWTKDDLEETEPGSLTWIAHQRPPITGRYRAFYVGISYNISSTEDGKEWPIGQSGVMDFTTTVSVVPNTFPYEDCNGIECYGTLL